MKEAARLYRLAADQGNVDAQADLGGMYLDGEGVRQAKEAARLYRLAAKQGDADAQTTLGDMYKSGEEVKQGLKEAAGLYSLVAERGHRTAQNRLGYMNAARQDKTQTQANVGLLVTFVQILGAACCIKFSYAVLAVVIPPVWTACCIKVKRCKRHRAARQLVQERVELENAGRSQRRQEEEQRRIQLQHLQQQEVAAQFEQRQERLRQREVQREQQQQQRRQQRRQQQQQQQQAAEQKQRSQETERRKKEAKAQKEQAIQALRTAEERAVFWKWADKRGYHIWERFVEVSVSDVMELKMSFRELEVVLQGLANDNPTSWAPFKSAEGQTLMHRLERILDDGNSSPSAHETAGIGVVDPEDDSHVCVICMAAPISVSLVHSNETSHLCLCVQCSDRLKAQVPPGACPICRAPVVVHLKNVFGLSDI